MSLEMQKGGCTPDAVDLVHHTGLSSMRVGKTSHPEIQRHKTENFQNQWIWRLLRIPKHRESQSGCGWKYKLEQKEKQQTHKQTKQILSLEQENQVCLLEESHAARHWNISQGWGQSPCRITHEKCLLQNRGEGQMFAINREITIHYLPPRVIL